MDYKKKLKQRLYIGLINITLGIAMIIGVLASNSDNDLISAFGLAVAMVGITRIIQYLKITKNDSSIKKQEIYETDERNLLIIQKARSTAFTIYLIVTCTAVIITSLLDMPDVANQIGYSQLILVVIYWICYWIYQKKL